MRASERGIKAKKKRSRVKRGRREYVYIWLQFERERDVRVPKVQKRYKVCHWFKGQIKRER